MSVARENSDRADNGGRTAEGLQIRVMKSPVRDPRTPPLTDEETLDEDDYFRSMEDDDNNASFDMDNSSLLLETSVTTENDSIIRI